MKIRLALLAVVPAVLLTSCYVTPEGGPYGRPPGPGRVAPHDDRRLPHDRDPDRDRRDFERHDREDTYRDRDGNRNRSDRDDRGRPGYGYRDPRGPGSSTAVVVLPRGSRRVVHGGSTYYTSGSTWYRTSGSGYIVTTRPY